MNTSRKWLAGITVGSLLLTGCVSKVTDKEQYSGYLDRYDVLQPAVSSTGLPVLRWVSPRFDSRVYNTVIFDSLDLYPAPKATDRINALTFKQLQDRANSATRIALTKEYNVIPSYQPVPAGSKALILHAAITGVSATNEGMQWYEVIPVAAVVGTVNPASGHRDQNTELYIEAILIDADTNEPVARVVRKVFGKTINNEKTQISSSDFNQAIDGLGRDLSAFLKH